MNDFADSHFVPLSLRDRRIATKHRHERRKKWAKAAILRAKWTAAQIAYEEHDLARQIADWKEHNAAT